MSTDNLGVLALAITTALVAWPHVALFRRPRPNPAPPASAAPTANQDGATGHPTPDATLDNACAVPKGYGYGYAWVDADHIVAEWQETTTPVYGWVNQMDPTPHPSHDAPPTWNCRCVVVCVQPGPPTELDAIAARFDARVDDFLAGRASAKS